MKNTGIGPKPKGSRLAASTSCLNPMLPIWFFSLIINYLTSKVHNLYLPLVLGLDKVNHRLCLKLKNLEHRALIPNSKGSWTKCSWG
ncbi:hypothetical protein V6Z12_D13G194400 [Gossypium hirsutum]